MSWVIGLITGASLWLQCIGVGGFIAASVALSRWLRRWLRRCKNCNQPRVLLDEQADDEFLDEGQLTEEHLSSVNYDVWWCKSCDGAWVERHRSWSSSYEDCPRCDYKTLSQRSITLRAATYDHEGTVRVTIHCKHCDYND